jgi:hypothetical protein
MPLHVTPKSISLRTRETQVFHAAGAAGTVAWSIQPRCGRIDQNGVYTAPLLAMRNVKVAAQARDGAHFDTAEIMLDAGWFWLHVLGVYWLAWAALLMAILLGRWDSVCPNCRPAGLLLSPPLATVTASQQVRFTATAPVTWADNMNSGGLYIAPQTQPANPNIDITAASLADPTTTSGASLTWSPDVGVSLEPQHTILFNEGRDKGAKPNVVAFNPVYTFAPDKQGKFDASKIAVDWKQPPIGKFSPNGTYTVQPGEVTRATTILIMANVSIPGSAPKTAGAYVTLIPKSAGKSCQEDGTPGTGSLIALIALAGALGGLIHGASSFAIFAGNREFKSSWTWWYVLRPVLGAAVALVVYLVVRSGLGIGGMALSGADCLKTAGFAGLIGMFAEPATLKLKDIFNTIFTPRHDPRKDVLIKPCKSRRGRN